MPISLGILGLVAAFMVYARILQTPSGDGRGKEIADEIHLGAMSTTGEITAAAFTLITAWVASRLRKTSMSTIDKGHRKRDFTVSARPCSNRWGVLLEWQFRQRTIAESRKIVFAHRKQSIYICTLIRGLSNASSRHRDTTVVCRGSC